MNRLCARITLLIAGLLLCSGFVSLTRSPALAQTSERCFPETGYCIAGRIRTFWEQNGGLPVFGFPITPQQPESVEGQVVQVQWFERNRLELHPENARPYDVLLGRLGAEHVVQQGTPAREAAQPACRYFEETGFNVCGELLAAWQASGLELDGAAGTSAAESLALFGLPLTGTYPATALDGQSITVQWFERARFELHPNNAPPYNVLLGLLGVEANPTPQAVPAPPVSEIIYSSGGQQFAINPADGSSRVIGAAPPRGSIMGPNATQIWVEAPEVDQSVMVQPFRILQAGLDGSNQQVLLNSDDFYRQFPPAIEPAYVLQDLVLSSDQTSVFFQTCIGGIGSMVGCTLRALDLSSRQISQPLVAGLDVWIAPDGQRFVFVEKFYNPPPDYGSSFRTFFGRVDQVAIQITDTEISDVAWLADGRFVYSSTALILADANGSTLGTITSLPDREFLTQLISSSDQQHLAYLTSTNPYGTARPPATLWVVNLDGTGQRSVATLPGDAVDLAWR